MNIQRFIKLPNALAKKSIILFGPRQTGKSWLIKNTLQNHQVYNLLHHETFLKLSYSPGRLREEYVGTNHGGDDQLIIIDEIQLLPILLNEVHAMIEEFGVHFLLTGSSARKLRRRGVNLLGGRAHIRTLHPLSICELKEQFDVYIKTVIDLDRQVCSAGMNLHFEGEQILRDQGSEQSNIWGGGIDLVTKEIDFNSFINIRPNDNNTKN